MEMKASIQLSKASLSPQELLVQKQGCPTISHVVWLTHRDPCRYQVHFVQHKDKVFVFFLPLHVVLNVLGSGAHGVSRIQDLDHHI